MFGILLAIAGAFFVEIGCSIAKYEHTKHNENIWAVMFLNCFFSLLIFAVIGLSRDTLDFAISSWPIIILGMIFGISSNFVSNMATLQASRTMAGIFRMLTVPMLTIIDYMLGYDISPVQILGVGIVVLTILALMRKDAWHRASTKWLLGNTIMTIISTSLYKYSIDNIASVETVQVMNLTALLLATLLAARIFNRQNLLLLFRKPFALLQSGSIGLGSVLDGFAYSYAPASIIGAAYRSAQAFWTLVSGSLYFHEHKIMSKIIAIICLTIGVVLLIN